MFLSLFRVIKFSFQDIIRNIWLSLVTIIILILALFTVNMLLVVKAIGNTAEGAVKNMIDVSVDLKTNASDKEIEVLISKIKRLPNVKNITYISKEEALPIFKKEYQDNPDILQALNELGQNPLSPTIIIKPVNLDNFDSLVNQLNALDSKIIESRDFTDYKLMLQKINDITDKVNDAGIVLSIIFVLITLLVVYNSVRVAIYTHRREISIMKLVGASTSFVQMPYLLSSFIYTCIAMIFIIVVFYPFLSLLQPYLETFFVDYHVNLIEYFYGNIFTIFGIQLLVASLVNAFTSFLAVRKYAKI